MGSQGGGNLPPLQPQNGPPQQFSMAGPGGQLNHLHGGYKAFQNWPGVPFLSSDSAKQHHQRSVSAGYLARSNDDLGDSQGKKRGAFHRRSASDSVALIEPPSLDSYGDGIGGGFMMMPKDFDKFDEEQLMSIFAGIEPFQDSRQQKQVAISDSMASLSDHHSSMNGNATEDNAKMNVNSHIRSEPEVQSACNGEQENVKADSSAATTTTTTGSADSTLDPKRIKRIIANRQSAQRSRIRKLLYISELERSVTALQAEVATISPQVAFLDHQRVVLKMDNGALKERISALERDKVFKDAHSEALKKELQRLRKIYQQQQQQQQTHCKQQGAEQQEMSSNATFDLKQH